MNNEKVCLINARDLIYDGKDPETAAKHFFEKYPGYNRIEYHPGHLTQMLIRKKEFSAQITRDVNALTDALTKMTSSSKSAHIQICQISPETIAYCVVSGGTRRYIRSCYQAGFLGSAAWSFAVLCNILCEEPRIELFYKTVESRLAKRCPDFSITMARKSYYLPYIIHSDFEQDFVREMYEKETIDFATAVKKLYLDKHADEVKDYETHKDTWYHDEYSQPYTLVEDTVQEAVNKLYKNRKELEEYGLWDDNARKAADIMYDIIYKRGTWKA